MLEHLFYYFLPFFGPIRPISLCIFYIYLFGASDINPCKNHILLQKRAFSMTHFISTFIKLLKMVCGCGCVLLSSFCYEDKYIFNLAVSFVCVSLVCNMKIIFLYGNLGTFSQSKLNWFYAIQKENAFNKCFDSGGCCCPVTRYNRYDGKKAHKCTRPFPFRAINETAEFLDFISSLSLRHSKWFCFCICFDWLLTIRNLSIWKGVENVSTSKEKIGNVVKAASSSFQKESQIQRNYSCKAIGKGKEKYALWIDVIKREEFKLDSIQPCMAFRLAESPWHEPHFMPLNPLTTDMDVIAKCYL